jgi:hydrogenase maturation protease
MSPQVLVIGLGNPLRGDDGVGPCIIEELTRHGLPKEVTALDAGAGGLDLLRMLEGWKQAIIVDAADIGKEPGQFICFTPDEAHFVGTEGTFSLHDAGMAEALALADALGQPLPEMVIFGVQPARVDWGEGLSPAMEAALPVLVDAVLDEAARLRET